MLVAMTEPENKSRQAPPRRPSRFEDGLAYLLAFSEGLLELVPDGIGVLDDRLRVRSANRAFAEVFGFDSAESIRGVPLRSEALFRVPVPDRPGVTLGLLLRNMLSAGGDEALYFERLEVQDRPDGPSRRWSARVMMWDTEDPQYRRVLLWVHPWRERGEPALPEDAALASRADRFSRLALDRRLFDHVPVCVVDASLRVQMASPGLEAMLGHTFDPDTPGDRHVFAVFPPLRVEEVRMILDVARQTGQGGSVRIRLPAGGVRPVEQTIEIEVGILAPRDERASELLLLLHEVEDMASSPSTDASSAARSVPETLAGMIANLEHWPAPASERVLLVESDSWTRMLWSDALREAGVRDIALCESREELWQKHDPATFGAAFLAVDGAPDEVRSLCTRLGREARGVPLFGTTDRADDAVRSIAAAGGLAGLFVGGPKKGQLAELLGALFRWEGGAGAATTPDDAPPPLPPADAPPSAGPSAGDAPAGPPEPPGPPDAEEQDRFFDTVTEVVTEPPAGMIDVVVLGAREAEVPQLRALYAAERLRLRLVFDPEPNAFGLSLARNLGIPVVSGQATLPLEQAPDVVVLARDGMEDHVASLGLERSVRVTRHEIALFLEEPETFLPVAEAPASTLPTVGSWSSPEAGPEAGAEPEMERDFAPEREPEREPEPIEAPEPPHAHEPERSDAPEPRRAREPGFAAPPRTYRAAAATPPPTYRAESARDELPRFTPRSAEPLSLRSAEITHEVSDLLGALDLLLDFDRLADRVLHMAVEMTDGATGSLMLLTEDRSELRIAAGVGLSRMIIEKTRQRVGDGIAGRIVQDREPLLLVGTIRDDRVPTGTERPEIRSSVSVPVLADGEIIGVLNVNSDPTGEPFDQAELTDVAALGRSVGTALDRSRQLLRMRGRSFELSVRAEIEAIASTSDDILSRLRRVTERVVEMLSLDTCGIWLYDADNRSLALRAVAGLSVVSMDAVTVPVGSGHVGWVAKNLRPLVLRSQADDPGDPEAMRLTNVGVPIRYQTELVGVLTAECMSTSVMSDERVSLVGSIASVIGDRIGRSREFQDSERKVTLLSALSELGLAFTSATERQSLARLVTFTATTLLESEVAMIRLLREDVEAEPAREEHYEVLTSHGATVEEDDPLADLEASIMRDVVLHGRPCTRSEIASDETDRLLQRSNVSSFLGIPVLANDALVGVLSVFRVIDPDGKNREYGAPELEVAERLGDYAGAAALRFVRGLRDTGAE